MPTDDSPLKNMLLAALSTPQVFPFPTSSAAHKARFAMYNALKRLRKAGDTFGDMRDLLEFIVRPAERGDQWELRIQEKSTNLMDILRGYAHNQPAPLQPPSATLSQHVDAPALAAQVKRETPHELDPTSPEGQRLLRRLEINDWADTYCDNHPQMNFMQLMAAINQLPPMATLAEAQHLLREAGVIE